MLEDDADMHRLLTQSDNGTTAGPFGCGGDMLAILAQSDICPVRQSGPAARHHQQRAAGRSAPAAADQSVGGSGQTDRCESVCMDDEARLFDQRIVRAAMDKLGLDEEEVASDRNGNVAWLSSGKASYTSPATE